MAKFPLMSTLNIPFVKSEQIKSHIKALGPLKATELDGLGPKIFKLAINSLRLMIAILIDERIHTGQFLNKMKCAKNFQYLREEINRIHQL